MTTSDITATFAGFVDLVSERFGGRALVASDEFFAPKENLLKVGRGLFIPDKYTDRGKWMDGWESRRKRTPGYDWCIVKLGVRGIVSGVDIDTNHFLGNNPSYASIDACDVGVDPSAKRLVSGKLPWKEILPKSPLRAGAQNLFSISSSTPWTHLRLNIYPDGGVARFRAYGRVLPDWKRLENKITIDLASVINGGLVIAASDMFFGSKENLIMPGRAINMGDGWETKRRRGPGYDWAIVKLGRAGIIRKIEVDTNHFKGNYPDSCSIDVCSEAGTAVDALTATEISWKEILPKTKLRPHARHMFDKQLKKVGTVTHVRLNIYPDGGVSRLRVFGTLA